MSFSKAKITTKFSDISLSQPWSRIYVAHANFLKHKSLFQRRSSHWWSLWVIIDKCISTEKVSKCMPILFFLFLFHNLGEEMLMEHFLFVLIVIDVYLSFFILLIEVYISIVGIDYWNRPYYSKCTRSHPNSEVKRDKAGLVLRWGTAWETPVLTAFFVQNYFIFFICFREKKVHL